MPSVERAILNLAAVVVGHNLAAPDATTDEHALGWKRIAKLAPAGGYEIRRPAVKRRGEFAGGDAWAGNDRFVISGEGSVAIAQAVDADRPKMVFKKFPGAFFIQWNGFARVFANVFQHSGDRGQIPSG